jgi:hypothetical protein
MVRRFFNFIMKRGVLRNGHRRSLSDSAEDAEDIERVDPGGIRAILAVAVEALTLISRDSPALALRSS